MTSAQSLATPAVILIAAHRAAYHGYIGYMGWDDPPWAEASNEVWQAVGRYLDAVNEGAPQKVGNRELNRTRQ